MKFFYKIKDNTLILYEIEAYLLKDYKLLLKAESIQMKDPIQENKI